MPIRNPGGPLPRPPAADFHPRAPLRSACGCRSALLRERRHARSARGAPAHGWAAPPAHVRTRASALSPPSAAEAHPAAAAAMASKHVVKTVEFLGRKVPVLMQGAAGPSPLLAIGALRASARQGGPPVRQLARCRRPSRQPRRRVRAPARAHAAAPGAACACSARAWRGAARGSGARRGNAATNAARSRTLALRTRARRSPCACAVNVLLLRNSAQLRPRAELSSTELLSLAASKLLDIGSGVRRGACARSLRAHRRCPRGASCARRPLSLPRGAPAALPPRTAHRAAAAPHAPAARCPSRPAWPA
jgi:hypothetical protein